MVEGGSAAGFVSGEVVGVGLESDGLAGRVLFFLGGEVIEDVVGFDCAVP